MAAPVYDPLLIGRMGQALVAGDEVVITGDERLIAGDESLIAGDEWG